MAGMVHKIGETFHTGGGKKEGDQQKGEQHCEQHGYDQYQHKSEDKEGFADKIKEKVHGGNQHEKGEKKKKKDKHGNEHSSDSD